MPKSSLTIHTQRYEVPQKKQIKKKDPGSRWTTERVKHMNHPSCPPPTPTGLVTADLTLGDWGDPGQGEVDADVDDTDDPEGLCEVGAVAHEAEDDGEDDAAEVAAAAGEAREDAVGEGVDVGDEGEVGAVAGLEEDGHEGGEAEHGGLVVGVDAADDDEPQAREQAAGRDPALLEPEVAPAQVVQHVGDDPPQRAGSEVEEAEHGRPVCCF